MFQPSSRVHAHDRAVHGPEHLFLNSLEELHPWRLPQDCLAGCLGLTASVEPLLHSVAAARETSMRAMYKIKSESRSGGGGIAPSNGLNGWASTDRLSLPTRTANGGMGNGYSGAAGSAATFVMKSARSQRKAAERAGGATLMDLTRGSRTSLGATEPSSSAPQTPLRPTRRGGGHDRSVGPPSREASPDVVRDDSPPAEPQTGLSVNSLRRGSMCGGGGPGWDPARGNKLRGTFRTLRDGPRCRDRARTGRATGGAEGECSAHARASEAPQRRSPSPHPVVPAIPRFAEFLREQERLLKQLEEQQRSSGKLPPAALRTKKGYGAVTDSDTDEDVHDMVNTDGGSLLQPRSGSSSSPPPPGQGPVTARGTAHPWSPPAVTTSSARAGGGWGAHGDDRDCASSGRASTASSSSEFSAQHASEANFGEDGHYVCVPGDTLNHRYTLIQQLGVGRSSRVWLAVDLNECSPSRQRLIRCLGEDRARRLFNQRDRPMFVAIKIFRCGEMYTECASYESRMMEYIKEGIRHMGGARTRQRPSLLGTSLNSDTMASTTSSGRGLVSSRSSHHAAASAGGYPPRTPLKVAGAEGPEAIGSQFHHPPRASLGPTWAPGLAHPSGLWEGSVAVAASFANHVAVMRDKFVVEGEHGTHPCLVMDLTGAGIDEAINETRLRGLPLDVTRSILTTALRGLAVLASLHIIHTDVKPENLLFMDLEERTVRDMDSFQRARLEDGVVQALWSSGVRRRVSVADYAANLRESPSQSRSSGRAPGAPREPCPTPTSPMREGGSLRHEASLTTTPTPADSPSRPGCSPSMGRGGEVCTGDAADLAPRTLYEVRVSDYGLSFIVPPALRDGVEVMRALSREYLAAQRAGRWGHTRTDPSSLGRRHTSITNTDDASSPPPTIEEDSPEADDCVMRLSPRRQLRLLERHRRAVLESSHRRVDEEETSPRGSQHFDSTYSELASVMAAQVRSSDTQAFCSPLEAAGLSGGSVDLHPAMETPARRLPLFLSPRHTEAPPGEGAGGETEGRAGAERPSHGSGRAPAEVAGGRAYRGYARQRSGAGTLVARNTRGLREVERSILIDQVYERGITIQSREYRAPEVLLGTYVLPSCDVWSIGCVAYELVTGGFLFDVAKEYEKTMASRLLQHREQQRWQRRCGHRASRDTDEAGARYADETDSDTLSEPDEELLRSLMDIPDRPEKNLDVVHLKCMMRLLGPPPLAFLRRAPGGVFVKDFFDEEGNFLYMDHLSPYSDEAVAFGLTDTQAFRDAELSQLGPAYAGHTSSMARADAAFPEHRCSSPGEAGLRTTVRGNVILYRYDDDDDDEFQREMAYTVGDSDVVVHRVHSSGAKEGELDGGPHHESGLARGASQAVAARDEAAALSSSSGPPHPPRTPRGTDGHPNPARDPADSTNYPIRTSGWRALQRTIREHIASEEEAVSFESLLLRCLQWDPAKRATAAELLASPWLTRLGPLATTASLANTMTEDALDGMGRR